MKTQPISRKAFLAAQYTIERVNPVISALEQLDEQVISDKESFMEALSCHNLLKKIRDSNLAILDAGNLQYENRPTDLINRAASRLNQIPHAAELEEKTLAHRVKARDYKTAELLAKNFTNEEVNKIIPEITQSEFDESKSIIAKLNAESKAILQFLNDGPRFDVALLVGTSLEQVEVLS
jgi:hypothetical protein